MVHVRTRVRGGYARYERLPLRCDLFNHSPTGFEWGYEGSGPAQLALAILADTLRWDGQQAIDLHQRYKREVVARLDRQAGWEIEQSSVLDWIRQNTRPEDRAPSEPTPPPQSRGGQ